MSDLNGSFGKPEGLAGTLGTDKSLTGCLGAVGSLTGELGGSLIPGPKGDTGPQGPRGETGERGPIGETGAQGPQGEIGPAGPKGDTGAKGDTGERGETGPKGDTGEPGPKGDKGDKGDRGDTGATGPIGPAGPQGDQGPQGETGPKGDKGDTGEQGETGQVGPMGPQGDRGPKGDKGDKGDTGETGPQGLKGDKGDKGDSGVYIGDTEPTDTDISVWVDTSGDPDPVVQDVQINGNSIVSGGVANIPKAGATFGVVKINDSGESVYGIGINASGQLYIAPASSTHIKQGESTYRAVCVKRQHESAFYGLAKAAGDTTMPNSGNAVGTYTPEALVAIQKMLGLYQSPWELIADYTVPEDSETVEVITDLSGQPFELTESFIRVSFPPSLTGKNDYVKGNTYVRNENNTIDFVGGFPSIRYMENGTATHSEYKQELIGNILRTVVRTASSVSNTQNVQSISTEETVLSIMGFRLRQYNTSTTLIPAGTHIQLYGRRKT